MSDNKPKYVLCPRCELNYIEESEGYCKVCQAALGLTDGSDLLPDDEMMIGEKICPICKENPISEDEEMCSRCRRELEKNKEANEDNDESWREFVDDEEVDEDHDLSLEEMADEEMEKEEEESYDDPGSLPDDFEYVDDSDLGDDLDDEEEEEEEIDED